MEDNKKITLTEEQAEQFIKKLSEGDIFGLEYLTDVINNEIKPKRNDRGEDIYDILHFTIELNTMNAHGEEFEGVCSKNYVAINELYQTMKNALLDMFSNDFNKYFEKYW